MRTIVGNALCRRTPADKANWLKIAEEWQKLAEEVDAAELKGRPL
jgi:hypothetical protein